MESIQDFKEWLREEPPSSEIATAKDTERQYIPIAHIEKNLDEFEYWETKNFMYRIQRIDQFWFAEGSIELTVHYAGISRTLVGAISFRVQSTDKNISYAPTVLSLCISNAAMKLGNRFGRSLNGRLDVEMPTPRAEATKVSEDSGLVNEALGGISMKIKPDMIVIKKYEKAIKDGNQKKIDELTSMYELEVVV